MRAPLRHVNPFLGRKVDRSQRSKTAISLAVGLPHYTQLWRLLAAEQVAATPLTIARLEAVARLVDFPLDEIFLGSPQISVSATSKEKRDVIHPYPTDGMRIETAKAAR